MLSARGLVYDYEGLQALCGVSLDAEPGTTVGVIGPNGSGKSTLLKCLGGLLAPRGGEVLLNGTLLASYRPRERARLVAGVPQDVRATLPFTCSEVVLMGRMPHLGRWGRPTRADRELVQWAMEAVGCRHLENRVITALSGGERQMVFLAKALAQTPRLLLLDEPTQHLDLGRQAAWFHAVSRIARERSIAVVTALHDVNLAAEFCDRLLLLVAGKVVAQGDVEDVARPENVREAYGVSTVVTRNPETGSPVFLVARAEYPVGNGGAGSGAESL